MKTNKRRSMSIKNISTTIPNPFDLALHRFNTPKSLTVMKVLGAVGVVFIGYQIARRIYSTAQNTFDQYVVDHASEMRAAFDKVLRVEKRNGVSTVTLL